MIDVWSFDPGKLTGWAHLSVEDDKVSLFHVGQADHFQIGDMFKKPPALFDREVVFVCESYRPNPRQTPAPWSTETIGLLRYIAYLYNIEFILISPSEHKSLIKDDTIKRAGLWTPGMDHANDAVRVGLYYLIKERRMLTSCLRKSTKRETE